VKKWWYNDDGRWLLLLLAGIAVVGFFVEAIGYRSSPATGLHAKVTSVVIFAISILLYFKTKNKQ
jgi:hypothetical protein